MQVAKKDETIRKCYKLLAAIHSNSSSIIQSVKQTGTIGREIKDLEEQACLLIYLLCNRINDFFIYVLILIFFRRIILSKYIYIYINILYIYIL